MTTNQPPRKPIRIPPDVESGELTGVEANEEIEAATESAQS